MCSPSLSINSKLIDIEQKICASHLDEKLYKEFIAVSKITTSFCERRGRSCIPSAVNIVLQGTIAYNSFGGAHLSIS